MGGAEGPLVLIVAGGTGGHLYPGIAVAQALVRKSLAAGTPIRVAFVVRSGDLGREILQREGFEVHDLPGQGFPRELSFKVFTFPVKLFQGFKGALDLIQSVRPDLVLGMGGYLSFPVLLAAKWRGARTMIHEQNMVPGLANKILGRTVDSVAASFPESVPHFPALKTWVAGLPIRDDMRPGDASQARARLGLSPDLQTLLIFGGSLGAHRLNQIVVETWRRLGRQADSWQVIHITGRADEALMIEAYRGLGLASKILPYSHEMPVLYAAADLVICRSGASTVAELLAVRRRAVLIPFPYATGNHQFFNAQVLEKRGRGSIILEKDLTPARLGREVIKSLSDPARRENVFGMEESGGIAADRIADFIGNRLGLKLL